MAIKNLRDVHLTAGLQDKDGQLGTSGQILSSTGSQVNWIDQGDIVAGETDKAKSVTIRVKNSTATAMSKGQVICEAVSANPPGGNLIEVALADNNGTNKMPALGILNEDLDAAGGANDEGDAIMFGKVSGINTSAFSVGDEVFVDDTPGGLTTTKPTGTKYIQKVGVVIRDDASNGTIEVFGAGRVNDVPTPLYVDHANQRLGIGATSPQKTLDVDGEVLLRDHLFVGGYGENASTNSIEIGRNRTGNGICFFDMTTDNTTYTDYGFRLIRYSGVNANTELIHRGTGGFKIKGQEGSNVTFSTSNSERMRITSGGNIGIGTTSPTEKLHVTSAGNPTILIEDTDGSNQVRTTYKNADFTMVTGLHGLNKTYRIMAGDDFNTTSNRIASFDGNNLRVGIGDVAPARKLHVKGSNNVIARIETTSASTAALISFVNTTSTSDNQAKLGADDSDGNKLSLWGSNIKTMTLGSGNVGIGTTSPGAKLDIYHGGGDATSLALAQTYSGLTIKPYSAVDSKLTFSANSGNTQIIQATNNSSTTGRQIALQPFGGNVGIGTTAPIDKLQVNGTLRVGPYYSTNDRDHIKLVPHGTDTKIISPNERFHIENTSGDIILNAGGNVGIGTTSPSDKLEIAAANQQLRLTDTDDSKYAQFSYSGGKLTIRNNSTTTSANQITLQENGNVGVGTTSPGYNLVVGDGTQDTESRFYFNDGSYTSVRGYGLYMSRTFSYIRPVSDESQTLAIGALNSAWGTISNNALVHTFGKDSSEFMRINSSGNVGIGTTSPGYKFVVNSSTADTVAKFESTDSISRIELKDDDDAAYVGTQNNKAFIGMEANATGTNNLIVTSDGKVGIGTTSPGEKLHINGGNLEIENNFPSLRLNSDNASGVYNQILSMKQGSTSPPQGELWWKDGNQGGGSRWTTRITSAPYTSSYINLPHNSSGGNFAINIENNERLTIDRSNGNVGIGTTSPDKKLEVSGDIKISGSDYSGLYFENASGTTKTLLYQHASYDALVIKDIVNNADRVTFKNNGSVGIGTDSPSEKLVVRGGNYAGSQNGGIAVQMGDESSNHWKSAVKIKSNSSGIPRTVIETTTGQTSGQTNDAIQIDTAGKVGIGTASPQYQLHSYNEIGTQTLKLGYGVNYARITTDDASKPLDFQIGGSTKMSVNQNGNVGIGTTSPGYNLDVTGTARITNNMWLGSNIYHDNDGNSAYIGFPTDDTWRVVTSGSERLRVNPNGNVGIGVTGPNYALDVNGTVDATSFRAGGISKYTTYNSTNTYENYGSTISNIASSPVGYLYHDLLAFNYNYTVTQESLTYQGSWQSETLDKRLFSQKQDQAITVVSSSEYAVRWTVEGTAWNSAKFINLAFTYTNPHPETRVIIESSADGTTWTSRHDSTASGITGTKSCYVSNWSGNNYVRITISKTSNNTNLIKLSSVKMMTARAGDQGDGQELQYPYVWDEDRNIGLLLTKSDTPTSKLDILGATNTSSSSLLRVRTTDNPNAPEKVVGFYVNTNTERGYIGVNQYGVTYSTSSDYRLKENVVPLSDATERLKLLKPCRFNFIESDSDYVVDGFLAHEAAEVVPESVNGEKDAVNENNEPIYQGIDQSKIVPLLTAALQEAIEKIEQLENRIQTLENN